MILYKYLRADYAMQAIETLRLKVRSIRAIGDVPLQTGAQLLEIIQRGYTVKGLDWKYENEYGEFVLLPECVPSGTLYFSPFRPGSLREVILGERCTLNPRYVLELVVHSKRNSVGYQTYVLRSRSLEDSFSMKIENPFEED
jgi:hypothetical protein